MKSIVHTGIPLSNFVKGHQNFFPQGNKTPGFKETIQKELPIIMELNKIWDDKGLGRIELTPIGIAIGLSYINVIDPSSRHLKLSEFTSKL